MKDRCCTRNWGNSGGKDDRGVTRMVIAGRGGEGNGIPSIEGVAYKVVGHGAGGDNKANGGRAYDGARDDAGEAETS